MPIAPTPLCLVGATASGKSDVALCLAARIDAEIISADSMQVYRGLDIATAKPTLRQRAAVPHHCLDLAEPHESFSAALWLRAAETALVDIAARGKQSLVVGGTGLYLRALARGLDDLPSTSPEFLERLSNRSLPSLAAELLEVDAALASSIDLCNRRRVERALAIAQSGARRSGDLWTGDGRPLIRFGLRREPADLRKRIEARVHAMFESGLLAEFQRLRSSGFAPHSTAWQALGYKELAAWVDGSISETQCRERLATRTWQFARRQGTWFRKEPEMHWIEVDAEESPESIAVRICQALDQK